MNVMMTASGYMVRDEPSLMPRAAKNKSDVGAKPDFSISGNEKKELTIEQQIEKSSNTPDSLAAARNKLKNMSQQQSGEGSLTDKEKQIVNELRARDKEVRAHEQNHKAAAGALAKGAIQYSYQRGPDGEKYAVGGEINIDTSSVPDDPEATVRKAQQIINAALANAEPSSADRQVAAKASQMESQARQQISEQAVEEKGEASKYRSEIFVDGQKEEKAERVDNRKEVIDPIEDEVIVADVVEQTFELMDVGGQEILGLVQSEQDQQKAHLPSFFADSELINGVGQANANQFASVENMVSVSGFISIGSRLDLTA